MCSANHFSKQVIELFAVLLLSSEYCANKYYLVLNRQLKALPLASKSLVPGGTPNSSPLRKNFKIWSLVECYHSFNITILFLDPMLLSTTGPRQIRRREHLCWTQQLTVEMVTILYTLYKLWVVPVHQLLPPDLPLPDLMGKDKENRNHNAKLKRIILTCLN